MHSHAIMPGPDQAIIVQMMDVIHPLVSIKCVEFLLCTRVNAGQIKKINAKAALVAEE